jgi:two-component system, sensor histidine kinase and response regulator
MPRILLVDDDPDILETLRYSFEHAGFVVETASDGAAALQAARMRPPALAILDVMLPEMNGYEVSRTLKQEMRAGRIDRFPIVIVTARRVASAARQEFLATWSQADSTLWKPFDLGALMTQVRRLVAASPVGAAGGGRE